VGEDANLPSPYNATVNVKSKKAGRMDKLPAKNIQKVVSKVLTYAKYVPLKKELAVRQAAKDSLLLFTQYTKANYKVNWHHRVVCKYLDKFVKGEIKKLMIFLQPQSGKALSIKEFRTSILEFFNLLH